MPAARAVTLIGIAYAAVLVVGMSVHGLSAPIVDPILALMELLTLASAPAILALVAAIATRASAERRVAGVLAIAFAAMFALATMMVHFEALSAGRQTGRDTIVWPSTAYAVELLAWDLLLGLALLCSAGAIAPSPRARAAKRGLMLTGILCLAGTAGPLLDAMRLQFIGVFGYAVVLPVVAWRIGRWLEAERAEVRTGL